MSDLEDSAYHVISQEKKARDDQRQRLLDLQRRRDYITSSGDRVTGRQQAEGTAPVPPRVPAGTQIVNDPVLLRSILSPQQKAQPPQQKQAKGNMPDWLYQKIHGKKSERDNSLDSFSSMLLGRNW
jgi:hypothetical protein